jgi:hypothetical protein
VLLAWCVCGRLNRPYAVRRRRISKKSVPIAVPRFRLQFDGVPEAWNHSIVRSCPQLLLTCQRSVCTFLSSCVAYYSYFSATRRSSQGTNRHSTGFGTAADATSPGLTYVGCIASGEQQQQRQPILSPPSLAGFASPWSQSPFASGALEIFGS